MEAGSDTTRVSLGQMIAGAATYPDWVARAREHLDRVCGKNAERLPQWSDFDSLPYITAVVKESFRWRPNIAPLGAPTTLIKDDEYEGYRFPAGTVFTWNAWYLEFDISYLTLGQSHYLRRNTRTRCAIGQNAS